MTTLQTLLERTFDDAIALNGEENRHLATIINDCGDISRLKALAAALAYGIDEDKAKEAIIQSEYTFFDVDNYRSLGKAILKEMQGNIPDGIAEYFNYERLGKDFCASTNGRITRYGFFSPRKWNNLWWLVK